MLPLHDPDHLNTALRRFRAFFDELRESFFERDDLLVQVALALLSRQHVLMTGPPGTAKSQMASLVLGRILDESTGRASLFARQFTENTVQTDLIGPINFKTLMESGRTEHFTDEGMLGSVHAFLDEVFDGRDMLLRSTLNILHEREVKQGGATAKGRIECAFMTSNRYIAEILDTTRETLLAFIDRISFISFIPRGFADPKSLHGVVRRHGGGFGRHTPSAYLSVQDLDVLQAAADMTYVSEEICDAVARLVLSLDAEFAAAQRADPKFQPTRYLSTRTAVQATDVLRAFVVYDKIFGRHDRPLQVEHDDLKSLRYFLLLNGVARDSLVDRVAAETDPRERRQLDIMATEAEIFDRCFAKLPRVKASAAPRTLPLQQLASMANHARSTGDPGALEEAVKALLTATESGAADAADAAHLLVDTVGQLSGHALRGGLAPDLAGSDALSQLGSQITEIADALERTAGRGRPLADWLRGRLLRLLDGALRSSACPTADTVTALSAGTTPELLAAQIDARFQEVEALGGLRRQLRPGLPPRDEDDQAWSHALGKLEDELTLLWDTRFRLHAMSQLKGGARVPLDQVLRSLSPVLAKLRQDAERFGRLGRDSHLARRVTGPRLEPLVARAFAGLDGRDRTSAVSQVESVVTELRNAGLAEVITPERFVAWTAPALIRDDAGAGTMTVADQQSYEASRSMEPALSITDTLIRVAIAAAPAVRHTPMAPTQAVEAVWETLRALDEASKAKIIELDVARASRGVQRLESWWGVLVEPDGDGNLDAVTVLESVVSSGFLRAIRGEAEPLRLAAELDHVAEVFVESDAKAAGLRTRLAKLDAESTRVLVDLLQRRSDHAWGSALGSGDPA
jgi:MoxR-like ATPase